MPDIFNRPEQAPHLDGSPRVPEEEVRAAEVAHGARGGEGRRQVQVLRGPLQVAPQGSLLLRGDQGEGEVHVLDVCAGGGITGVAMASALVGEGKEVGITAVDARENDLRLLEDWLRHAGLLGRVEFEAVVADAVDLPNMLRGRYDISVLLAGDRIPAIK